MWREGGGGEGSIAAIQTNVKGGQEGKIGGTGGRRLKMGRGGAGLPVLPGWKKGDHLSSSCGQARAGRGRPGGAGASSTVPVDSAHALHVRI